MAKTAAVKKPGKTPAKPKAKAAKKTAAAKTGQKPRALTHKPIPGAFKTTTAAIRVIRTHWRVLLGIVAVYLVLNILFASGLSGLNAAVETIRSNFNNASGESNTLAKALSGFGTLVGSGGSSGSSSASLLQSVLFLVESLVIIWALRQLMAGKKISVKEAYYHSTYPLIPFLLVAFIILIQLLPVSLGVVIINAVLTSAIANVAVASWLSVIFFLFLAGWSFYMLTSSLFALYIVTLPEMHPREALRSAKQLVKKRRLAILPKIIYLPIFILLVMAVIIIPLIILATPLVAPVFYLLSMLSVLFIHTYLYSLYRELLV